MNQIFIIFIQMEDWKTLEERGTFTLLECPNPAIVWNCYSRSTVGCGRTASSLDVDEPPVWKRGRNDLWNK